MSNSNITLSKTNYSIIILGCIIVIIGFVFMSGGGTDDPTVFNEEELFSYRRITLAPFLAVLGYMVVLFGVLKRAKISTPSADLSKKEKDGILKK
jgi:hypothetical protein